MTRPINFLSELNWEKLETLQCAQKVL